MKQYMTIKEAAKHANVKTSSIRYHIFKTGKLAAKRVETKDKWTPAWYVSLDSLENLYYKTREGEKQHTANRTFQDSVDQYQNIYKRLAHNPELYAPLAQNADQEYVEAAIGLLKALGYKVLKPVLSHEEV